LQARSWKAANKDACETVVRGWEAVAAQVRPAAARRDGWSQEQKHYAWWILSDPRRMAELAAGRAVNPERIKLSGARASRVRAFPRRRIGRARGKPAAARLARSFPLDANMYRVFEHGGVQYIDIATKEPRKRLALPLTGRTPIRGNVRVVLDPERRRVEAHYTASIEPAAPLEGEARGLDAGVTEVFTDDEGSRYGEGFGRALGRGSERLLDKGRKRGKLRAVEKRAQERGDLAKANRIAKYNLGTRKQRAANRRLRTEIERRIDTAINEAIRVKQPSVVARERLDIRGKARSKKLSRKVAPWARSALKDRMKFKASGVARRLGFRREQVNPAYSSQECPECGFVHQENRKGDAFECLRCGHASGSDYVEYPVKSLHRVSGIEPSTRSPFYPLPAQ
jgi:hypothetical protein